ncbi:MAG: hypothetical protein BJ554DRAFT_963, partial [Olpidium bornovanus]
HRDGAEDGDLPQQYTTQPREIAVVLIVNYETPHEAHASLTFADSPGIFPPAYQFPVDHVLALGADYRERQQLLKNRAYLNRVAASFMLALIGDLALSYPLFKNRQLLRCQRVCLTDHRDNVHPRPQPSHQLNVEFPKAATFTSFGLHCLAGRFQDSLRRAEKNLLANVRMACWDDEIQKRVYCGQRLSEFRSDAGVENRALFCTSVVLKFRIPLDPGLLCQNFVVLQLDIVKDFAEARRRRRESIRSCTTDRLACPEPLINRSAAPLFIVERVTEPREPKFSVDPDALLCMVRSAFFFFFFFFFFSPPSVRLGPALPWRRAGKRRGRLF